MPEGENPFEKKQDSKWIDVVPHHEHYKRAYLSILMKFYEEYRDKYNSNLHHVLRVTPTILKETQKFRNEQDCVNRFCTTQVIHVGPMYKGEPTERIRLEELAMLYHRWYRAAIEDVNISKGEMMNSLKASYLQKWIVEQHGRASLTECIVLAPNATHNPEDGEAEPKEPEAFGSDCDVKSDEEKHDNIVEEIYDDLED